MESNTILGGLGALSLLGVVILMLLSGGGTHEVTDPALCGSLERAHRSCIQADAAGEGHCTELAQRAFSCRLSMQGGSSEPTARDLL